MGAAGLTASSVEMAARAGNGLEIDLTLVPQRETGMTAYEMMLSESQERMLIVAKKGHSREVIEKFSRSGNSTLSSLVHVTDDQRLRVEKGDEVVADIPNTALTDEAPKYNRPIEKSPILLAKSQILSRVQKPQQSWTRRLCESSLR